jgi:hypothetical protein
MNPRTELAKSDKSRRHGFPVWSRWLAGLIGCTMVWPSHAVVKEGRRSWSGSVQRNRRPPASRKCSAPGVEVVTTRCEL